MPSGVTQESEGAIKGKRDINTSFCFPTRRGGGWENDSVGSRRIVTTDIFLHNHLFLCLGKMDFMLNRRVLERVWLNMRMLFDRHMTSLNVVINLNYI